MRPIAALVALLWGAGFGPGPDAAHAANGTAYATVPGSERLVTGMPAPRDQGELAYCYAAVPTVLLDRARCREHGLECDSLTDRQRYSMLHIAAQKFPDGRRLDEYGSINRVFNGLEQRRRNGARRIASEACAPYASLARLDMPERHAHLHLRAGWDYLRRLHGELKVAGNTACADCVLVQLRERLALRSPEHQLLQLLGHDYRRQPLGFPEFAYRLVIPRNCTAGNAGIALPDYRWNHWPRKDRDLDTGEIHAKITGLVSRDIPVSIAYCSAWEVRDAGARCQNRGGHASIVVGMRRVCRDDGGPCWNLYKLQNSYGSAWAEKSHRLWVRSGPLLEAALELKSRRGLLTWLE